MWPFTGQGELANGVQSRQAVASLQQQQRKLRVHERQQDVRGQRAERTAVSSRRTWRRNRGFGNYFHTPIMNLYVLKKKNKIYLVRLASKVLFESFFSK